MAMRGTVRGEADACRQKALAHVNSVKAKFNENTTDEEKFRSYLEKFERVAHGVSRCRENFSRNNYKRWLENKETANMLHLSNEEGIVLMGLLSDEMKQLMSSAENKPLSRVNGTSIEFERCAKIFKQAKRSFALTNTALHEKILCDRPLPGQPIIVQKLEAIVAMIMAHFIFASDALLT